MRLCVDWRCEGPCLHRPPAHRLIILSSTYTLPYTHHTQILRKIAAGEAESLGDISTLADPSVVDFLITAVGFKLKKA